MTEPASDSALYCPRCFCSPALELRTSREGFVAVCLQCNAEYKIEMRNGEFVFQEFPVACEQILGQTGMALLRQLYKVGRFPDEADIETRRQLQKLQALGLVKAVKSSSRRIYWELTQAAIDMLFFQEG